MKIEIKSMALHNFKKVRCQEIAFSHNMLISGGNKVGKTTIFDAYLWAIFGITSKKNGIVQPLDENNGIMPHVETSVTVMLNYNDSREIKIQRILTGDGTGGSPTGEKPQGATQKRLFNDVPLSQKAFNEKLEELCPVSKWMMLSNVSLFMSYKTEDRRNILMSLVTGIDERELLKPYPLVYDGIIRGRYSLSEMLSQQLARKKNAQEELKIIPAKIQTQEELRVNVDFPSIEAERENIDNEISIIDAHLENKVEKNWAMEEYISKVQAYNEKVATSQKMWQDKKIKDIDNLTNKISEAATLLSVAYKTAKEDAEANTKNKVVLVEITNEFNDTIKRWNDANQKEFRFEQTNVCPVCGRPYTDKMKECEYNRAVEEFNRNKSNTLLKIQDKAGELKQKMAVLKGHINTYEQIKKNDNENVISGAKATYDKLWGLRDDVLGRNWETSGEKKTLDKEWLLIEASKPKGGVCATVDDYKARKKALMERRDNLTAQLAGKAINERIDKDIKALDDKYSELAQVLVDSTEVISQISAYKKDRILAIEREVNSYFSLVRWKFCEQNKTNENEKDVCMAIDKDGVDYNNTNDGTVIDMGVDIINGISKALNIFVPLFVDRKESTENVIPIKQQAIFLQCVYGQPLKFETI